MYIYDLTAPVDARGVAARTVYIIADDNAVLPFACCATRVLFRACSPATLSDDGYRCSSKLKVKVANPDLYMHGSDRQLPINVETKLSAGRGTKFSEAL